MSLKLSEPLLTCLALSAALVLSNCSGSDADSEGTAGASGSAAEAGGAPAIGGTSSTGGVAVNGGAATSGASAGGSASGGSAPVGAGGSPPGNAGAGGRSSAGAAGGPVATGGVSPMGGAAGVAGSTAGSAAGGAAGGMAGAAGAAGSGAGAGGVVQSQEKPRVVVLTDIANEPDDEESLVRFLVNSNEFDVEALIATTSTHLKTGPREDLIRRQVTAYGQVHANLTKHAPGFPTAAHLLSVTKTGQTTFGMAAVGAGKGTAGSNHLISVIDKPDPRPVWVTIWGGANTFAQTMTDVKASRSAAELAAFVAKVRVYTISDQDDAGIWLRTQFPEMFYIVSPGTTSTYGRSTWSGISGDIFYSNGPRYMHSFIENSWLTTNVRTGHGPLGALYPAWKYIMEGDTPSYLGLVERGLGWAVSPSYGGWGGRYTYTKPAAEPRAIWTNSSDTFVYAPGQTNTSNQATIWRYRDHYQNDFAARMDWCIADTFAKANHNPVPALNGDLTKKVLTIPAKAGATVTLSAAGTTDPDGNTVTVKWWIYPEAGTLPPGATLSATEGISTEVRLPQVTAAGKLHVILQAEDNGTPHLWSYRRAILDVTP